MPGEDPHIREVIDGFGHMMYGNDHIRIRNLRYDLSGGGIVVMEYSTNLEIGPKVIQKQLHAISYGFTGVINRLDYPVTELNVQLEDENGDIGRFTIDREWAVAFDEGQITGKEFVAKVLDTLESSAGKAAVDSDLLEEADASLSESRNPSVD